MHIKRFEGRSMEEALGRVRDALGPDALILSTRQQRRADGMFGWLGRPIVEVTAAVDRDARSTAAGGGATAGAAGGAPRGAAHGSWKGLSVTRALVDPLEREVRELRRSVDRMARFCASEDELRRGLHELRRVTGALGAATARPGAAPCAFEDSLREHGLAAAQAARLAAEVASERRAGESAARCARRVLARRLDRRLLPPRVDAADRVALFVGATGAGKTTSVAKVAGSEIEHDAASLVVSTDVWRSGGEQALKRLAGDLDLPFRAALSADELEREVARNPRRRVLVDTPGRARDDASALPELLRCRAALGRRGWVAQVVSATTKSSDLRAELERFRELEPDALIVTRVDESEDLWNVANLLLDEEAPPLAWVGTGQRVPEDLWVPDPHEMADRIVRSAA